MRTETYNKISTFVFTILALILFGATHITAAPGDLDLTFGSGGIVVTSFTNFPYIDEPRSIQVQPDGKIVVCGGIIYEDPDTGWSFTVSFFIARYHPTGALDASFGTNGKIVAPFNPYEDIVGTEITLQPDGKIIAVGNRAANFAVNRYNANGTLDASFGTGGKVVTQVGNPNARVNSVMVQPDGKIVVGGGDGDDFIVVRYNPNGSLDTSFGDGGKILTDFNNSGSASAVMLQPDGKIVAAGFYLYNNNPNALYGFALARYNADGSLDSGFGVGGKVVHPLPPYHVRISDAVLQPDGRIVVGGHIILNDSSYRARLIVRYNANGSIDTGFAANGIFTAPNTFSSNYREDDIVLQPDGKIVTFGSSNGAAALRLNPNGSTDTGFGTNGIATATFGSQGSYGTTGAIQPNGRILLLGQTVTGTPDGYIVDIAIARYLDDSAAVPRPTQFDFDGDRRADVSVFRPSDRTWYLNQSTNGFSATQFGLSTDKITPADFDGDGRTDISVYRAGIWYWLNSSNNSFNARQFGIASDIPVPTDFTGDGRAEIAVYRNGAWWIQDLTNNQTQVVNFGLSTDKPVVADYDGDGRADQAVYRNGEWHLNRSSQGYTVVNFGLATDKPTVGDYDGDGRADSSVYRDGTWYILQSSAGTTQFQWGIASDVPAPADYDGDGKTDAAVFRDGVWYLRQSASGFAAQQFGLTNDKPVPATYLP